MAYNTGNPIGSIDPRDAADNKENFERFALSTARTYTDRLGVERKTVTGTLQDYAAYNPRGVWTTATAYNVNDVWRDGAAGAFYLVLADYTSGASAAADIAGGNVSVHQPKDWVVSVATISDLRALEPAFDGQQVSVASDVGGFSGGGTWLWDSTSSAADNGHTVVSSNVSVTGRWFLLRREYQSTIDNSGQETGEQGVLTVYQRPASGKVGFDVFNFSGVDQSGATHTSADGNYSQVLHHYNDKTAVIWDYVGREEGKGNTIALMRMAYNSSASGHTESGTGYFQRFERTVKFDPNAVYPDNRTLAGFKQVDLFDLGLSATDNEWAFVMHGRDASLTDSIGRSYIQQPIHFWTYGNSANNGAEGLKIFSGTKGGDGLKVQTNTDSVGRAINVNHKSIGQSAVVVENNVSGSSASYVSLNKASADKDHYVVQTTVAQSGGFALKITDNTGATVGGISADGKNLFLTDRGDGTLRSISVLNGVLQIS